MWIGKFIGALFGYLVLRLPGAIIGFMIGNMFDKGFISNYRFGLHQQGQVQAVFFRITFQVMGHIAKADGRISESEIEVARSVMQRMNLSENQKKQAIEYFNQGKQADFDLARALSELVQACHHQRLLLRIFIEIQFQAAMVGGRLDPSKQRILEEVCKRLGLSMAFSQFEGMFEQLFGAGRGGQQRYQTAYTYKPSLSDDYKILGVPESASQSEIKRAYRRLMSQHHPDKLIAKGLPEEMIKLATDKTQTIQAAYERVRQSRGF